MQLAHLMLGVPDDIDQRLPRGQGAWAFYRIRDRSDIGRSQGRARLGHSFFCVCNELEPNHLTLTVDTRILLISWAFFLRGQGLHSDLNK